MRAKKRLPEWAEGDVGKYCQESCVYVVLLFCAAAWAGWGVWMIEADDNNAIVGVFFMLLFLTVLFVGTMSFRLAVIPNATDRSGPDERVVHMWGFEQPWTLEQFITCWLFLIVNLLFYGVLFPTFFPAGGTTAGAELLMPALFTIFNLTVMACTLQVSCRESVGGETPPQMDPAAVLEQEATLLRLIFAEVASDPNKGINEEDLTKWLAGFTFDSDAYHTAQGPTNLTGLCQVSYVKAHPGERRQLSAGIFNYADTHQCRCFTLEKKWNAMAREGNAGALFRAVQANGAVGRYIDAAAWSKPSTAARLRAAGAFPDPDDLAKRISLAMSDSPFQEAKRVYREALEQNEVWRVAKKVWRLSHCCPPPKPEPLFLKRLLL